MFFEMSKFVWFNLFERIRPTKAIYLITEIFQAISKLMKLKQNKPKHFKKENPKILIKQTHKLK